MVKQKQKTDRCFLPAAAQVRFPVGHVQGRPLVTQEVLGRKWSVTGSSSTADEERRNGLEDLESDGGSGEVELKRARVDRVEEAGALADFQAHESCAQPRSEGGVTDGVPPTEQSGDGRAAERQLQNVGSLKVTIQQSSGSREFGQTDKAAVRQTGGLHCHVCSLNCRSVQAFQEHMAGSEHLRKLKEITHTISLNAHMLQSRGRRPGTQHWCDACQTHFCGDVITHRRTEQHKMCKQVSRPFCPACRRHFRSPRKFVEHMKSPEHKQQVQQAEAQEEELITVDAVGCFEQEEGEVVDVCDQEEEQQTSEAPVAEETHGEEYDPNTIYGSTFVVPVSGFLCRLCNEFFHRETTARHTHCRTHTHYLHVQKLLRQKDASAEKEEQDESAQT